MSALKVQSMRAGKKTSQAIPIGKRYFSLETRQKKSQGTTRQTQKYKALYNYILLKLLLSFSAIRLSEQKESGMCNIYFHGKCTHSAFSLCYSKKEFVQANENLRSCPCQE